MITDIQSHENTCNILSKEGTNHYIEKPQRAACSIVYIPIPFHKTNHLKQQEAFTSWILDYRIATLSNSIKHIYRDANCMP